MCAAQHKGRERIEASNTHTHTHKYAYLIINLLIHFPEGSQCDPTLRIDGIYSIYTGANTSRRCRKEMHIYLASQNIGSSSRVVKYSCIEVN